MTTEKIDYFIPKGATVICTEMNHITEVQYLIQLNREPFTIKLSKDLYMNTKTGAICEYTHSEHRGLNLNSLRQTFKKLGYLINYNFVGALNELWMTLTFEKNETSIPVVMAAFKNFIKRLKRYCKKIWGATLGYFDYIAIKEPQERGAWHFHLLVKFPNQSQVFLPNDVINEIWQQGFVNIRRLNNSDNIGAYVCSYLSDVLVEENSDNTKLYDFSERGNGATGVFPTKKDPSKRVKKGGRLHLYPPGMNIFSKSKGIEYPDRVERIYDQIFRSEAEGGYGFQPSNLTSRTARKIIDDSGKTRNVLVKETYNKQVSNPQAILERIRFVKERIEKLKKRGPKRAKLVNHYEQELYGLLHKQDLYKLKRDYLKKRR